MSIKRHAGPGALRLALSLGAALLAACSSDGPTAVSTSDPERGTAVLRGDRMSRKLRL
jgi:hypothetical protein